METQVDEIAAGVYRLSTYTDAVAGGFAGGAEGKAGKAHVAEGAADRAGGEDEDGCKGLDEWVHGVSLDP